MPFFHIIVGDEFNLLVIFSRKVKYQGHSKVESNMFGISLCHNKNKNVHILSPSIKCNIRTSFSYALTLFSLLAQVVSGDGILN